MASGPTTSCQINGETVADFISGGSQITADGDCSHDIKRHLLLGRNAMTNLVYVSCSVMSDSATPWTVGCEAPLFMEFSRQEHWSGLPFPSSEDLPGLLHFSLILDCLSH